MKSRYVMPALMLVAGCSNISNNQATPGRPMVGERSAPPVQSGLANISLTNMSIDRYKRVAAQHVVSINPDKIYPGNPQAMLRSVVVVKYVLDANGRLVRSDILRSNGDDETASTALAALRRAAPYPRPPSNLLSQGRLEILETLLFNDDGRFQLRSIAAPQLEQ
jgi:protein TonB